MTQKNNEFIPGFFYAFARGAAVSAFLFIIMISSLLVINWVQLTYSRPVEAPALENLYNRLKENPGDNALKEEIRILDLMIRKAFFTKQWQSTTGGYLLFGALAVLTASFLVMRQLKKQLPVPGRETPLESLLKERSIARWVAGGTVLVLALPALLIAFTAGDAPDIRQPGKMSAAQANSGYAALYKQHWPAFRGPGGNGTAETATPPLSWDGASGAGILWKSAVPLKGFNSPVVWDKKIFLSGGNEQVLEVYCYNADSGLLLWQQTVRELSVTDRPGDLSDDTGYAAPTMATNGGLAFAVFATGDLTAFDFAGNMIWSRNLGKPEINYGYASSLIAYDNLLVVQYDHSEQPRLLFLEPGSGETVREIARDVSSSWASPVITNLESNPLLILNANPYVTAYELATGNLLWSTECMNGEVAPAPAAAGGKVFAVNQFAVLAALDIGTGSLLWEYYDDLPNVSSPAANRDFLFMAASYGAVSCLDTADGSLLWLEEFPEGFYSSPVIAGSNVYLTDMTGTTYIFAAAGEYRHIAHCMLGENTVCTPAFVQDRIYIRGDENLYCIGKGEK